MIPINKLTDAQLLLLIARKEWPDAYKGIIDCTKHGYIAEILLGSLYSIKMDSATMHPLWTKYGRKYIDKRISYFQSGGFSEYEAADAAFDRAIGASLTCRGIAEAIVWLDYPDGVPEEVLL